MLGKTNITALQEGAIVEDIEDFRWLKQDIGITDNFVRTLYKNGYLVGITAGGKIAYTKDGEVWQTVEITHESSVSLSDIEWDGTNFLICGWYSSGSSTEGIIFKTEDFSKFEVVDISILKRIGTSNYGVPRVMQILYLGSQYLIATTSHCYITDLKLSAKTVTGSAEESVYATTKNSNSILLSTVASENNMVAGTPLIIIDDSEKYNYYGGVCYTGRSYSNGIVLPVPVFCCRDVFYACSQYGGSSEGAEYDYSLVKVTGASSVKLSNSKNFGFISGCYFNKKYVFINKTSMLVFSKESEITDKTPDDMIDIGAESELSMIVSAFDKIFIFGTSGLILKSTNEVNNEEGILVQHLSAKQALAESKRYTDEKIVALEARVKALEGFHNT